MGFNGLFCLFLEGTGYNCVFSQIQGMTPEGFLLFFPFQFCILCFFVGVIGIFFLYMNSSSMDEYIFLHSPVETWALPYLTRAL